MEKTKFEYINFSYCSSFIFKINQVFIAKQDNPSEKIVKVEEELDGISVDGIGNLGFRKELLHHGESKMPLLCHK